MRCGAARVGQTSPGKRLFGGWNAHDIDAILKLTGTGSYRDPITGTAIHGEALRKHAAMLFKAFPDLYFELEGNICAGAIGLTWIRVKGGNEPFQHVATITRNALEHLSQKPGFVTGIVGAQLPGEDGEGYGFTISAWEKLEDMDQILANSVHKDVVHKFVKEKIAYATHSRVYQLVRAKPLMVACEACGRKNDAHNKTGKCSACGEILAAAPAYW